MPAEQPGQVDDIRSEQAQSCWRCVPFSGSGLGGLHDASSQVMRTTLKLRHETLADLLHKSCTTKLPCTQQ